MSQALKEWALDRCPSDEWIFDPDVEAEEEERRNQWLSDYYQRLLEKDPAYDKWLDTVTVTVEANEMKLDEMFPSDLLKAADLMGKNVTKVMSHVEMEKLGQEIKPILYFQGTDKKLVLNKTNSNAIGALYGDDTLSWSGKPVTLESKKVEFKGDIVDAIRIMLNPPVANLPPKEEFESDQDIPF